MIIIPERGVSDVDFYEIKNDISPHEGPNSSLA